MSLEIIGVGFGRTGTLSLKLALDRLGFGPCHHMVDLFERPEQARAFIAAANGAEVDFAELFSGYRAAVDWPAVYFWRELLERFPNAKAILTTRDDDSWYESMKKTIFLAHERIGRHAEVPPGTVLAMNRRLVGEGTFDWRFEDRDYVVGVHRAHLAAVRATVAPERLFELDVREGWEPLCRALGVPVPEEPFPRANSTEDFLARMTRVERR